MRGHRGAQFTLVEMLVVVAIIGVLAALLMPGLQGALAATKTVECANTQKRLYIVFCQFAEDHEGILPLATFNASVTPEYANALFPPVEALSGNVLGFSSTASRNTLWPYLSSIKDSISCPADPRTADYRKHMNWWQTKSTYVLPKFRFSYCHNNWGYGYHKAIARLSNLRRPSQLLMIMESDTKYGPGMNYFEKGYPGAFARFGYHHNLNTGFNAGFSDGHVEFINLFHEVEYELDYKNGYLQTPQITKNNWE